MKIKNIMACIAASLMLLPCMGCKDFLDRDPDSIMTDDQVFGDAVMVKSLLANMYGRITWGQHTANYGGFNDLDEAAYCNGGPNESREFSDSYWRVYDYALIRNLNQALAGVRATGAISDSEKKSIEGEIRFIRAWVYFNMARCMGGMPIVEDEVFEYTGPDDVVKMRKARSTEAGIYDYIIDECTQISNLLPSGTNTHSARANKWAALMLKARAAIYAGSIAKYNNLLASPVKTAGGEVGIPADKADGYYRTALEAATSVIDAGVYKLQQANPDLGRNFYEAVCVKDNNTEVIWARDYKYPGQTHGFSAHLVPPSHAEDIDRAESCPVLNLVEDFEYSDDRDGSIKAMVGSNYVFYDKPEDAFANKDARLWGTVIYPGADFKGTPVILQAGQMVYKDGAYEKVFGQRDEKDSDGKLITAYNGPVTTNDQYVNKTGFFFRKFMDETSQACTRGRGSEMWFPYFRISEAYLVASEASMELGNGADACKYINVVRRRAGIQDLSTVTLDDIVRENRVEFAFEGHRWWDLKRWRLADKVWNGVKDDARAQQWVLFPYLVVGGPNDGKYVYEKSAATGTTYPRYFQMSNYYNFISQEWLNNNPLLVKNPYQ